MEYSSAYDTVKRCGNGYFAIHYNDGTKVTKRLGVNENYRCIIEFFKRRRCGYPLNEKHFAKAVQVSRVSGPDRSQPSFDAFEGNFRKMYQQLKGTGLWTRLEKSAKTYLLMPESWRRSLYSVITDRTSTVKDPIRGPVTYRSWYDKVQSAAAAYGIDLTVDMLDNMTAATSIKPIRYPRQGGRKALRLLVEETIREAKEGVRRPDEYGTPYRKAITWKGKYDYQVAVERNKEGEVRGWYTECTRDTDRGSTWLILNADNAILAEKY